MSKKLDSLCLLKRRKREKKRNCSSKRALSAASGHTTNSLPHHCKRNRETTVSKPNQEHSLLPATRNTPPIKPAALKSDYKA